MRRKKFRKFFRTMFRRQGRMRAALPASVAAAVLAVSGVAIAQSNGSDAKSHRSDAPSTRDKSVSARHSPARAKAAELTNATLSNSIGFDISAPSLGAYAEVDTNFEITTTPPVFKFVKGWTQVTRIGPGHYCLNGAGYNYPAVVSVRQQGVPLVGYVTYDSYGYGCPGVGVWTYALGLI